MTGMGGDAGPGTPADIRRLLCFVAAVEAGSAPEAAARLGARAPWLSAQIRALERSLGVALVQRQHGRLVPTTAGQALATRAAGVVDRQERLAAAMAALLRAGRGEVRLGASRLSTTLPERIRLTRAITQQRPGMRLSVHEGDSEALLEALVRGEDDLAIALVAADRRHRGVPLQARVLRRARPMLVGPPGHVLGGERAPVDVEALVGEPLATFPRSAGPALFDRLFQPLIAAGVDVRQDRENHPQAFVNRVVVRGELTVLPDWLAPELISAHAGVWARSLEGLPAGDELCLVRRAADDSPPAAAAWALAAEALETVG